jgi:integrase
MSALPLPEPPATIPFPTVYQPPDPRTPYPGVGPSRPRRRHKPAPNQSTLWPTTVDPEVLAAAEVVEQQFRDPVVPEANRVWLRKSLGLRQFYQDWLLPERRQRVVNKQLAAGTLAKDRQALTRWERFTRPPDWPAEKGWPGIPLGSITGLYLAEVLVRMRRQLGEATTRSTWNHLRTIFNRAVKVRALDFAPAPERVKVDAQRVQIYRPEQIEAAYRSLAGQPALQVSFVLAINAGPRPVDLFLLRREQMDLVDDRPTLSFRSRKTGKEQTVPLAPVTVRHLRRLVSGAADPYLFPGLSSPASADPEKSWAARRRRAAIVQALASVGISFPKPFQAARATCNTRLNTVRDGAGVFVLGHGLTLNSKSYMEPTELIFEAVNAVKQPACFADF